MLEQRGLLPAQRLMLLTDHQSDPSLAWLHADAGRFEKALKIFDEARQLVAGPESELRLETQRIQILSRMDRVREVLRRADGLAERFDTPWLRFVSLYTQAVAWVRLDSLESARLAVEELRAMEEELGGIVRYAELDLSSMISLATSSRSNRTSISFCVSPRAFECSIMAELSPLLDAW